MYVAPSSFAARRIADLRPSDILTFQCVEPGLVLDGYPVGSTGVPVASASARTTTSFTDAFVRALSRSTARAIFSGTSRTSMATIRSIGPSYSIVSGG